MADVVERRTRANHVLPDTTIPLDLSPLKQARTALRSQVELAGNDEEGTDSEEDPILLSPQKVAKSNKRALESPQASLTQTNPRFKRLRSEPPEPVEEHAAEAKNIVPEGRPTHSRHRSETAAVKKPRSKPPSTSKKSSSSTSSKPRAKSVPVFPTSTSLPFVPSIDFRNPPPSPTRSRSRSPSKEPKLDITLLRPSVSCPLDSIVDEETHMDIDTATPKPHRERIMESTPRANPLPILNLEASLRNEPVTPKERRRHSSPMSPLTPIEETPAPLEKQASHREVEGLESYRNNGTTPNAEDLTIPSSVHVPNIDLTATQSATSNPIRPTRPSRVPLPKKSITKAPAKEPEASSSKPTTSNSKPTASGSKVTSASNSRTTARAKSTIASTSKLQGTQDPKKVAPSRKKADPPPTKNAFSVLMSNRPPMTEKEKQMSVKSKMKSRTHKHKMEARPIVIVDDEEPPDEPSDKHLDFARLVSTVPPALQAPLPTPPIPEELVNGPIPSSPPTSPLSELPGHELPDDSHAQPAQEGQTEPLPVARASSLFSADGDMQIEDMDTKDETIAGDGVQEEARKRPSSLFSQDGDLSDDDLTPPTNALVEEPQPMEVAEPDVAPPPPVTETPVSENSSPSARGKAKRGPRKRAAVNPPARVTRSVSSKKPPPEVEAGLTTPDSAGPSVLQISTNGTSIAPVVQGEEVRALGVDESMEVQESAVRSQDIEIPPVPTERPDSAMSSELSDLPSDMDEDSDKEKEKEEKKMEEPQALQPFASSKSLKSQLPVKARPSLSVARATKASLARAALPKTPTKSRSASPSKLPRSSSLYALNLDDNSQRSRPVLAVAGSSYAALESALGRLQRAPPSRPSTSMGFNRDNMDDDDGDPMQSQDDMVTQTTLGIGRPTSKPASSSSKSSLPLFKRPAVPTHKGGRGVFMPAGKVVGGLSRKPGAIMRGGIYDTRIAGGARGQKASQMTGLATVIGSPVKGGTATTMTDEDTIMNEAGPSNQGNLTLADITMNSDVDMDVLEGDSKGKKKAKEDKTRRASMALHALSQSLNDINTAREAEAMEPPSAPRRGGLRSSSSTYPSGKDASEKKKEEPSPTLDVLSDCKVFVDYKSDDPSVAEQWIQMLKGLGARIVTRLGPTCTHILWKDGLPSTINRYRLLNDPKPFVIGNSWIVSCADASKRVNESEYLIDLESYKYAAAGHKRRKSMIPKFVGDYDDESGGTGAQDGDVSMNSDISMSSDLTPLERARMRTSLRT